MAGIWQLECSNFCAFSCSIKPGPANICSGAGDCQRKDSHLHFLTTPFLHRPPFSFASPCLAPPPRTPRQRLPITSDKHTNEQGNRAANRHHGSAGRDNKWRKCARGCCQYAFTMACFLKTPRATANRRVDLGFAPAVKLSGEWSVKRVLEEIPSEAPAEGSSSPIPFFHMLSRLKTTKREGWRRFGIERLVCGWRRLQLWPHKQKRKQNC